MRKISDTSDIKQGDILRDPVTNALFEVIKVEKHRALLEIIFPICANSRLPTQRNRRTVYRSG